MIKLSKTQIRKHKIFAYIQENKLTYQQIADKFNISTQRVSQVAQLFNVNRESERHAKTHARENAIILDIKAGLSIDELTTKYDITRKKLFYIYRRKKPVGEAESLGFEYRKKRDARIIELFKAGYTAEEIIEMNDKTLGDPARIRNIQTIYKITVRKKTKRFPRVGNRTAGGCYEDKKVLDLIVKLHDNEKKPKNFKQIANSLNRLGYKTIQDQRFYRENVRVKYHIHKKALAEA